MYYPILQIEIKKVYRIFSAFLIFSLISVSCQTIAFADVKSKTAEEYRIQGYEEQQRGNFDKGLQSYTKSLSLDPNNAVTYNDVGVIYEQLGDDGRAEQAYLKAIRLKKDYLPPYINLAYFYLKKGDKEKARLYFEERITRARRNDPWAQKAKDEISKIDPDFQQNQQKLIEQEAHDIANEIIKKAREEFYNQMLRSEAHLKKGLKFSKKRAYSEALKEFDRALEVTPGNPKVLRAKAKVSEEQRKEDITSRTEQAMKKLKSGETHSAKEEFRKILTLIPDDSNKESE